MTEKANMFFKSRARLMEQLGEQLIKNENVALLELIKNSYDAGSRDVFVLLNNLDDPQNGIITILDYGKGMDKVTVENAWMEIGTDSKKRVIDAYRENEMNFQFNNTNEIIDRPPLGEKGIGRFGSHKLGKKIRMTTRAKDSDEIVVEIDWDSFNDYDYLDDVPIEVIERVPEVFCNNQTGTLIEISDLKKSWNRGSFRELYRSVNALNSPFESLNSFKVHLKTTHSDWIKGLDDFESIKDKALFEIEATLEGEFVEYFYYRFKPWVSLKNVEPRAVEKERIRIRVPIRGNKTEFETINLDKYEIGKVQIRLLIFDLDTKLLRYESIDKRNLSRYLDSNGGISLYRDNIRLYEYGDKGNDWLELEARRINNPSKTISSRICIGAVYLDRLSSVGLIEKASREGLVENDALEALKKSIWFVLDHLVYPERNSDKDKLRVIYGGKTIKEPVVQEVKKLKEKIKDRIEDESFREDLIASLDKIDMEYQSISEIYLRAASAGLGFGTAVHEIEKIVSELNHALDSDVSHNDLVLLAKRLTTSTNAYASLLKSNKTTISTPSRLVESAEICLKYRLKAHEIDLIKVLPDFDIKCKGGNLIVSSIINIVDNSIYWIEFSGKAAKRIAIVIDYPDKKFARITIADSGCGFTIPTENAVSPFITSKDGGMGIGLYLANQVLEDYSGRLTFPNYLEFDLPECFKNGAFVALNIPRV